MGSSRKNRGHSSAHRRTPAASPGHHHTQQQPSSSSSKSGHEYDINHFDLTLREVEGGAFHITWKEILWMVIGILAFAALSIFIGMAAGISISIHYYENEGTASAYSGKGRLDAALSRERHIVPQHQRVTILDPSIANSNSFHYSRGDGLDLGRVVTTSPSGHMNILQVVEESPLISDGSPDDSQSSHHYGGFVGRDAVYGVGSRRGQLHQNAIQPPRMVWQESAKVKPKLCPDGYTMGFDQFSTLKAAVQEANSFSAERFVKWNEFFALTEASFTGVFEDESFYYEEDIVLTICPGMTLKARKGPIFINAENVIVECEHCTIDVGGSHFSFGPQAKNVLIRGITFKGAQTSSLVFFHDGAEASFEDCLWIENVGSGSKFGAVADVNSTSIVNFYRCSLGNSRNGVSLSFPTSLSLRS